MVIGVDRTSAIKFAVAVKVPILAARPPTFAKAYLPTAPPANVAVPVKTVAKFPIAELSSSVVIIWVATKNEIEIVRIGSHVLVGFVGSNAQMPK